MLAGLLGGLVTGLLMAWSGHGGGWGSARASAATVGGLAGGALLLSGTAGRWAADLSPAAPAPGSIVDLALTCAGAALLLVALGLAGRRAGAGLLTVAAGLASSLAGAAVLEAVAASWTRSLAAVAPSGLAVVAARGTVLAGAGLVLLAAGLRALCVEHALRWAPAGRLLEGVAPPPARDRITVEAACELAA
jgi:hypothetical protein